MRQVLRRVFLVGVQGLRIYAVSFEMIVLGGCLGIEGLCGGF